MQHPVWRPLRAVCSTDLPPSWLKRGQGACVFLIHVYITRIYISTHTRYQITYPVFTVSDNSPTHRKPNQHKTNTKKRRRNYTYPLDA